MVSSLLSEGQMSLLVWALGHEIFALAAAFGRGVDLHLWTVDKDRSCHPHTEKP